MKNLALDLIDLLPEFATEVTDGAVILFTGLVSALDEIADKLVETMPEVIDTITTALGEHGADIFTSGFDILLKLIDGIIENLPKIMEAAQKILDKLVEYIDKNADKLLDASFTILESLADFVVKNLDGDRIVKFIELGGKILDKIVELLIDEEVLSKLFEVAEDILVWLTNYLLDNSDKIFAEKMPELIDKLCKQTLTTENDQKMDYVGEKLGEALMRGFWAITKGIFKSGYNIAERSVLAMFGIEGDTADMVMGIIDSHNKQTSNNVNSGLNNETAAKLREADREAYLYNQGAEWDESGTVVQMPNGEYGPYMPSSARLNAPAINVYNPIINNASDIERIAEQTRQLQDIAAASGGRY